MTLEVFVAVVKAPDGSLKVFSPAGDVDALAATVLMGVQPMLGVLADTLSDSEAPLIRRAGDLAAELRSVLRSVETGAMESHAKRAVG